MSKRGGCDCYTLAYCERLITPEDHIAIVAHAQVLAYALDKEGAAAWSAGAENRAALTRAARKALKGGSGSIVERLYYGDLYHIARQHTPGMALMKGENQHVLFPHPAPAQAILPARTDV
jgi:hypothetical protein